MGWNYPRTRSEIARDAWAERKMREDLARDETAERMALADKIVMVVVDRIAADIIRPGPKPEERECYVMAQELRDHTAHLKELVAAILKIEEDEA